METVTIPEIKRAEASRFILKNPNQLTNLRGGGASGGVADTSGIYSGGGAAPTQDTTEEWDGAGAATKIVSDS